MNSASLTAIYLVLGLAVVAGLYYILTQITARQRRVNAELTRLERLSAEVAMNAEAVLERVDERIDRLNALVVEVEVRMAKAPPAPMPEAEPVVEPEREPEREPEPVAAPEEAAATPARRDYQEARTSVWALADQGKGAGEIATLLDMPRGEVMLLLNLRGRKVTA